MVTTRMSKKAEAECSPKSDEPLRTSYRHYRRSRRSAAAEKNRKVEEAKAKKPNEISGNNENFVEEERRKEPVSAKDSVTEHANEATPEDAQEYETPVKTKANEATTKEAQQNAPGNEPTPKEAQDKEETTPVKSTPQSARGKRVKMSAQRRTPTRKRSHPPTKAEPPMKKVKTEAAAKRDKTDITETSKQGKKRMEREKAKKSDKGTQSAQEFKKNPPRVTPKVLAKAVANLSPARRDMIIEMGFGVYLDFVLGVWPQRLTYWVVDHYDREDDVLHTRNEDIKIDEDLVEELLCLPRGPDKIKVKDGKHSHGIQVNHWRAQHGRSDGNITCLQVLKKIKETRGANEFFMQNFLVLLVNVIMFKNRNRYAYHNFLDACWGVDGVKRLNWCHWVIKKLRDAKLEWVEKKKKSEFTGSIALLVFAYLNRVKVMDGLVNDAQPPVTEWTTQKIKAREKAERECGGFGGGEKVRRAILPYSRKLKVDWYFKRLPNEDPDPSIGSDASEDVEGGGVKGGTESDSTNGPNSEPDIDDEESEEEQDREEVESEAEPMRGGISGHEDPLTKLTKCVAFIKTSCHMVRAYIAELKEQGELPGEAKNAISELKGLMKGIEEEESESQKEEVEPEM